MMKEKLQALAGSFAKLIERLEDDAGDIDENGIEMSIEYASDDILRVFVVKKLGERGGHIGEYLLSSHGTVEALLLNKDWKEMP